MEGQVHRIIVEVLEECMIVFTNDTFHAGVKSYENMEDIIYLIFVCLYILLKVSKYTSMDESIENNSKVIE